MHTFHVPGQRPYLVEDVGKIVTPRLLVFKDRVERNLERMKDYLKETAPDTDYLHLCSHVKTHKSAFITRLMMERGISCFKTSINEVELVASCGAEELFIAYPLLLRDCNYVAECAATYTKTRFIVQVGSHSHADMLHQVAVEKGLEWQYFIDVDVGMHRTGVAPDRAFELYQKVSQMPGLIFTGLHGYDGHNHYIKEEQRCEEARRSMKSLLKVLHTFRENGVTVPRIMVAGSPTFQIDFKILYPLVPDGTLVQVSPGTWVYWDSGYDNLLHGKFEIAAVIISQVIDRCEKRGITLNLGHKRWGADQGPVELFSIKEAKVISFNEEHTVLETGSKNSFQIGDYILVVPRHVCSTVNLYEHFILVEDNGKILDMECPVDARNR